MAEPFVGEIKMVGYTFAPRGWADCNGQLLPIAQNTALFSLLGTIYGGDGRTTFALPELRGRAAMHWGNGPGLTPRPIGQRGGTETNTLTTAQMPPHTHALGNNANEEGADQTSPDGNVFAEPEAEIYSDQPATVRVGPAATAAAGNGTPVNNMQPFLTVRFVIALTGIYPSRS